MLSEFLDFLYGQESGRVYVPTKLKDGSWQKKSFYWPGHKSKVIEHIEHNSPLGDVYICPAMFKGNDVTKAGFKSSTVVWADLDGTYNGNFRGLPQPNLIIQSSLGNNAHVYWKLDGPVQNAELIEDINRRLAVYLTADPSGWDCTQLLRPPGTINHKRDLPVKTIEGHEQPTAVGDFGFLDSITTDKPDVASIIFLDAEELLKA